MVCRVLKRLEHGELPDDLGELPVDGIVYLSQIGSHRVNVPNLFGDLCRLLPAEQAKRMEELYREPKTPTRDKFLALLEHFQGQPVIVLLDNLEQLVDAETRDLTDGELDEALRAMLEAPHHTVKILVTTRVAPHALALVQPQRQRTLPLDGGLESPYAENILRELDADGVVGLKAASDRTLGEVRQRTRGFPRALEAFYGSLAADRSTTLDELLARAAHALPDTVVETLVGEAFSRLDGTAQRVMQALAIYARPVPPVAVDYLLQPHLPTADSASVLNRLVNMHFVRKESGRYYLHPVDQAYALNLLPRRLAASIKRRDPAPWTQAALRHRAADFFSQTRRPRGEWKTLADLEPQLAEFDLQCAAEEYDTAANVLLEIDFSYLFALGAMPSNSSPCRERARGTTERQAERRRMNSDSLGLAYSDLGQVGKAIKHYEEAMAIAPGDWRPARLRGLTRQPGLGLLGFGSGRDGDQALRGGAGDCPGDWRPARRGSCSRHTGLGLLGLGAGIQSDRTLRARRMAIMREERDRRREGSYLGCLGLACWGLGQVETAIKHFEARAAGDCAGDGASLRRVA